MNRLFFACAGGALGSGARYLITLAMLKGGWTNWPWSTILVNIIGSFVIGLLSRFGFDAEGFTHPFLVVGVLGGFTTYSSFNQETLQFFHDGQTERGIFYLFMMAASCLAGGSLGMMLGRRLTGL